MFLKKNFQFWVLLSISMFVLQSCAPNVYSSFQNNYETLDYREEIVVLGLEEDDPKNAERIGDVRISDTGFSVNCGYDVVVEKAKEEARKKGGTILKIIEHEYPDILSSCHQITFIVYRQEQTEKAIVEEPILVQKRSPNGVINVQARARLFIYRLKGDYDEYDFDLYLGSEKLCVVSDGFKNVVYVNEIGLNKLWAEGEEFLELSINIEDDIDYYIQCNVVYGGYTPKVVLKLMDYEEGKRNYNSIKINE